LETIPTLARSKIPIHRQKSALTSGEYDYMLKVVATDMAAYEKFLSDVLMQIAAVRNVINSFSLRHKKLITALPLN
jgi:DNA-binding Lrp family transcriptional regulator